MRTTIRVGGTIAANSLVLFDFVANYQQAPMFIEGLQSLQPTSDDTAGEGASFDAVMKVGPKVFKAIVTIAALREGRSVTWASAGDSGQTVTFMLEPTGEGTRVVMEVSYERPSGLTGLLAAPVVEETVRSRAHASMRRLRDQVTSVGD